MATANVNGVNINYEIHGDRGPWVSFTGGGRNDLASVRPLAKLVADAGYRVVIHDRSNCGASGLSFVGETEQEYWADELHGLLSQLDALPVFVGGGSAGCRLSFMLTKRHPGSTSGLMVWRPSGGPWAAEYLAGSNHDDFLAAARAGGMAAVCETPFMRDRIAANLSNRARLMAMDSNQFIATLERWRSFFTSGANLPLLGMTEADLRRITIPCCVVAGQDDCHPRPVSERLRTLIPNLELNYLVTEEEVAAVKASGSYTGAYATVTENPADLARVFTAFLSRVAMAAAV